MKVFTAFLLLVCTVVNCEHLILGDSTNKSILFHTTAEYNGIPLIKREKSVFYNNPEQRVINAIVVYDRLNSKAKASVTAGGIGQTYVNLLLKSERGEGLDFDIGIFS